MNSQSQDDRSAASCGLCPGCDGKPGGPGDTLTGLRFGLASVAAFGLPLALAAAGAVIAAGGAFSAATQLAGAAAGLTIGAAIGILANKALRRASDRQASSHCVSPFLAGKELP